MVTGFWKTLTRPIVALAPMANVTDAAFRRLITNHGKPDVLFTEFVSVDGLLSSGRDALLVDLMYSETERPIVAQVFGATPEHFYQAALLVRELGFDGLDINMGCPDRNVERQGAGAALIKDPRRAQKIISEAKRGAGKMPVSIKTRIGYASNTLKDWLPYLLEAEPAAITLHARTRAQMSKTAAQWDAVSEAVELRDRLDGTANRTLILGNGDIDSLEKARERIRETDADGVMIGRGVLGNPWFFERLSCLKNGEALPPKKERNVREKLAILAEHTLLFKEMFGERKRYNIMKKHYAAYVQGFAGARTLRARLMATKNADEAILAIKDISASND